MVHFHSLQRFKSKIIYYSNQKTSDYAQFERINSKPKSSQFTHRQEKTKDSQKIQETVGEFIIDSNPNT